MARKTSAEKRAEVLAEISAASPHGFLIRVMNGEQFERALDEDDQSLLYHIYPTFEQSLKAATILLNKIQPDLKVAEVTGAEGGPIVIHEKDFPRLAITGAAEDEDAPPVKH